jgi:hypothetical protein
LDSSLVPIVTGELEVQSSEFEVGRFELEANADRKAPDLSITNFEL